MEQRKPVTASRVPWVAATVWLVVLAIVVVVGLAFGRASAAQTPTGSVGADPASILSPLAADPSPSASAGSGANGNGVMPPLVKGLGPLRKMLGGGPFAGPLGGPGGAGPRGPGRGAITITAIDGSQISLKTEDGWTRTIDTTGATIQRGDQAITVRDLKVGEQVRFKETRDTDGTFKITAVTVVEPQVAGTVKSLDGDTLTLTLPDGSTKAVQLNASTTYRMAGNAASKSDLKPGAMVRATGTIGGDGSFIAGQVQIAPATAAGKVTAKTSSSITVTDPRGSTTTVIHVDSTTTYKQPGNASASLDSVAVGGFVSAEGTRNDDDSLNAARVQVLPANVKVPGMLKPGKGPGQFRVGPKQPKPNASPIPSPVATTSAG